MALLAKNHNDAFECVKVMYKLLLICFCETQCICVVFSPANVAKLQNKTEHCSAVLHKDYLIVREALILVLSL